MLPNKLNIKNQDILYSLNHLDKILDVSSLIFTERKN